MHHPIPRQQADEHSGADNDACLSAELAAVLAGARRRAVRDGDRQVDTAHLLHSLLEYDPEVRAAFDGEPRLARLLGYLVQRSIGYGLRWQTTVEDSGAIPVVTGAAGHSPPAATAMSYAGERAARRGDGPARGVDLLAGIVVDPRSRAVEVLERAGIDVPELFMRIERGSHECLGGAEAGC
ncbi:Clp protease N-terminal domain-containing protein [Streptomyces chromofuscus]|uniref:Peptidase n=1 Tax=Streptomyces chromofuscus TaxID=42881 RepID=A0A7M2TCM9_STRCW|nr:Clp protease N-terminal domain-containing protein [Streptomyces chromofuscus]QOV45468.1 peptidase [Streptomyces chromofuscus]GGS97300.1 peptidase [Streptomyces chromofuscus]